MNPSDGVGFSPRVLPEPGETLTDRINRELAARGAKQRIVMVVDDPIAQDRILADQMEKVQVMFESRRSMAPRNFFDESTRILTATGVDRKNAAHYKRMRKQAKRLSHTQEEQHGK